MPGPHSHDAGATVPSTPGTVAALHRRVVVVVALPACHLLRGSATRHAPEVISLRAADLDLTAVQASRLGNALSIEPSAVRAMTFATLNKTTRRLIGAKPLQSCPNCDGPALSDHRPILRSQLLGWRVTCPLCRELLSDPDGFEVASPFVKYRQATLHGERLLDAEAERGKWTWASPVDIARLLLMRRVPKPPPNEAEFWRFRVLGAIIPEFDDLVAAKPASLPTSGTLILPLHLRPALLAGVAIVDRAGPGMLPMLQRHTMGGNRARFGELAERSMAHARKPRPFLQWQLI